MAGHFVWCSATGWRRSQCSSSKLGEVRGQPRCSRRTINLQTRDRRPSGVHHLLGGRRSCGCVVSARTSGRKSDDGRARILRIHGERGGRTWVRSSAESGAAADATMNLAVAVRCRSRMPSGCLRGRIRDAGRFPVAVGDAVVIRIPDGAPPRAALVSPDLGTCSSCGGCSAASRGRRPRIARTP